ncbi:MAG: phosphate/phosphite/phosphonate ABC transporter substrate-binding protein [Kiloniellales bacterium]
MSARPPVASLPMYDLPELRPAAEDWWRGLARALRAAGLAGVPDALSWPDDLDAAWRAPDLLLSQTCGYPLMTAYAGVLQVVATPVYDAPGCEGTSYSSAIVVRQDYPDRDLAGLRGATAAFNARHSQSGYNALRHRVAPLAGGGAFFGGLVETGGHAASLTAVAEGRADVAAIDCVTYALISRYRPETVAGLRVLTYTEAAPGLPYVAPAAAPSDQVERLRAGLAAALADPSLAAAREALLLRGAEVLPAGAYRAVLRMEQECQALSYSELR